MEINKMVSNINAASDIVFMFILKEKLFKNA